ncbi:MAG: class F sortase [Candidatus Dormibacteraceae bacterium]
MPGLPVTGSFSAPVEIVIPAIKLDARIESVGQDAAGAMGVPKDIHDAAWYQNGPAPGDPGDAVIDGHLDWYTGPAVFWNLGRLKPGDAIAVTLSNGTRVNFSTVATATYPYVSRVPGLFATSGRPELSLITCAGKWDAQAHLYLSRLVVSATVVGT